MATVLVIVHQETSNPWAVGKMLEEMGHTLDIRRPSGGDTLPESMEHHDAAVLFGGPMSANDDKTAPFIREELNWIPVALDSRKPFLGICLGAQMLSRVLGGTVKSHPAGLVEIGFSHLVPTQDGPPFFDEPMTVYQWHREGFSLPKGTKLLATGTRFPNQAFSYNETALGLQFHVEVMGDMMKRWSAPDRGGKRLTLAGAQSREIQLQFFARHQKQIAQWQRRFLKTWLALGAAVEQGGLGSGASSPLISLARVAAPEA